MTITDPGERQLLERELAESPSARTARRANDWLVTYRRIWTASERAAISDERDRIRFFFARLYPELGSDVVEAYVERRMATNGGMTRPDTAEAIVGERLATLMRDYGYRTR